MKNSREYIYEILDRVLRQGAYASLCLRGLPDTLTKEEVSFITEVVYGTLRNQTYLRYQWESFCERNVKGKIRLLLDSAVYQLFFLDHIPEYAIVNETVALVNKRERGFVNAILRKVIAQGEKEVQEDDEIKALSIRYSHPEWLLKMWISHYGLEKTKELVIFNQERAFVYYRINTLKTTRQEIQNTLPVTFYNDYVFTCEEVLFQHPFLKEGKILVQDISSSQIPLFMDIEKECSVLDVCSAPGTKAQMIGMLMENQGTLVANDIYPERVKLIESLFQRTGVTCARVTVGDGCILKESYLEAFDRVLLDVPCSGLGDLRHKPEIRYHVSPTDLDTLQAIQKKLLEVNSQYVKPNGLLVYSTCTLNKKENETQIRGFLQRHLEYVLEEEKTFFPPEVKGDGFYVARLRKTG